MKIDLDRRELLKIATVFAAAWWCERGVAMDAAPRARDMAANGLKAPASAGPNDRENSDAVGHSSNFLAIYKDPQLKAAFFLFLLNVYHIYPEDKFHRLIEEASQMYGSDKEIYRYVQGRLDTIRPFLADVRYALPALAKQKEEMARQSLELLRAQKNIDGYMEIGTTGRHVGRLKSGLALKGDIILVNAVEPTYSATDIVERGALVKLGRFVPLKDYRPLIPAEIADRSLDVVSNFIGFHHAPTERRAHFMRSINRTLRIGGRLIVRDHDVDSNNMNRIVALAHDVFNMGLGTDWRVNQQEIRHFTSKAGLVRELEGLGFKTDGRALQQDGDPTRNLLMVFTKVADVAA